MQKKAAKSSQKDARTTKHAGVLAPQNGNGVTKVSLFTLRLADGSLWQQRDNPQVAMAAVLHARQVTLASLALVCRRRRRVPRSPLETTQAARTRVLLGRNLPVSTLKQPCAQPTSCR